MFVKLYIGEDIVLTSFEFIAFRVPEEFAKGDRRAFEGYKMRDRGEFMRQVKQDSEQLKKSEMDELIGVAKMAGVKVKDPSERLNKFEKELLDDDDDLDLSV